MKWWRLLPWKSVARSAARRHGFFDPIQFLDRMRQFAQPSEVGEPIELLRAGAVFHARGLINRAVQFNLDWVWPYWIERQFNPADESFTPRAFSFSHINLTHRNWTAVGLPGLDLYPIVDPRGLVTPFFDGWSLDFWIVDEHGAPLLLPSKSRDCEQKLVTEDNLRVVTSVDVERELRTEVFVEMDCDVPCCVVRARCTGGKLVVTARPYNPEGISFIDSIETRGDREWLINGKHEFRFSAKPERVVMSCYEDGDVLRKLARDETRSEIKCRVGMATAGAVFADGDVEVRVPLVEGRAMRVPQQSEMGTRAARPSDISRWRDEVSSCAQLELPNQHWKELYDIAVRTLILHAPREVYPGPYTYKRFWYRDATFILNALASIGAHERCARVLEIFPRGQLSDGYFRSQEGEWDSNGEVLWILERCFALRGEKVPDEWLDRVERAARWILGKRIKSGKHAGLFPAGFSAEHLGLNDFYFWDDFWGVAGLRCAAAMLKDRRPKVAAEFEREADEFLRVIERAIADSQSQIAEADDRFEGAAGGERLHAVSGQKIPAAPGRRMDSGAVGSLVADFPLQLFPAGDERMMNTVEWLRERSFFANGFMQEMIHSGINAYLTLHVAQVLLRASRINDAHQLMDAIADFASPTGQWPEAIHPRTRGGCMGDGQHVWAAAEWVIAMRNLFVFEEGDALVIGAGLDPDWNCGWVSFGPAATRFGSVTVRAHLLGGATQVKLDAKWFSTPPRIEVRVPGFRAQPRDATTFELARER